MKGVARNRLAGFGIVALVAGLDQFVKYLVETRLEYQQMVEVIPFLALYRTYNTGMAFSLLDRYGVSVLVAISAIVALFVIWLWSRTPAGDRLARYGFSLILGGALGNLIDRVALGHVVDYILFHTPVWSFAIFNLADAAITIGAGLVILQEVVSYRRSRKSDSDGPMPGAED